MKKKCSIFILAVLLACTLTGCVTEKTREDIIERLEREGIIEEDWEYEYMIINDASPIPDIFSYDYIYTDDDETYMVQIQGKDNDDQYPVYIAEDVEVEEYEWTDDEGEKQIERNVVHYEVFESYKMQYTEILWFDIMRIVEEE